MKNKRETYLACYLFYPLAILEIMCVFGRVVEMRVSQEEWTKDRSLKLKWEDLTPHFLLMTIQSI